MSAEEEIKFRSPAAAPYELEAKIAGYDQLACLVDATDAEIADELVANHGWTQDGAEEIVKVVRRYGAWFLLNAAAVAELLEVQDGEAGF